ncbi:MAG: hypothetical protein M1828_003553 [Chrysothrix sp. TS-e1954]|nr:MAG: hypothetical protein M1828_003553 [Chrysothrix sp. TS-e1954]
MTQRRKQHDEIRLARAPIYNSHQLPRAPTPPLSPPAERLDPPLSQLNAHDPEEILGLARQYLRTLLESLDESEAASHAQDEWDVHGDREQAALLMELRGMMGYMLSRIEKGSKIEEKQTVEKINGFLSEEVEEELEDDEMEDEGEVMEEEEEPIVNGIDEDVTEEEDVEVEVEAENEDEENEDFDRDEQAQTEQALQDVLDEDGEDNPTEQDPSPTGTIDEDDNDEEEDDNENSGILISPPPTQPTSPTLPTQDGTTLPDGVEAIAPLQPAEYYAPPSEDNDDHSALCESCATLMSSPEMGHNDHEDIDGEGEGETEIPQTDETPAIAQTHDATPVFSTVKPGTSIKKKKKKRKPVKEAETTLPEETSQAETAVDERKTLFQPTINQQPEQLSLRMGEQGLEVVLERPPPIVKTIKKRRKPRPSPNVEQKLASAPEPDSEPTSTEEAANHVEEAATADLPTPTASLEASEPVGPDPEPEDSTPTSALDDPFDLSHDVAPSSVKPSATRTDLIPTTPSPQPPPASSLRTTATPSPHRIARAKARAKAVQTISATEIIEYAYAADDLDLLAPPPPSSSSSPAYPGGNSKTKNGLKPSPRKRTIIIRRQPASRGLASGVSALGRAVYDFLPWVREPEDARVRGGADGALAGMSASTSPRMDSRGFAPGPLARREEEEEDATLLTPLRDPYRTKTKDQPSTTTTSPRGSTNTNSEIPTSTTPSPLPSASSRMSTSTTTNPALRPAAVSRDGHSVCEISPSAPPRRTIPLPPRASPDSNSNPHTQNPQTHPTARFYLYIRLLHIIRSTASTITTGVGELVRLYAEEDAVKCLVWGLLIWRVCVLWGVF